MKIKNKEHRQHKDLGIDVSKTFPLTPGNNKRVRRNERTHNGKRIKLKKTNQEQESNALRLSNNTPPLTHLLQ